MSYYIKRKLGEPRSEKWGVGQERKISEWGMEI
jgi:hypothetical protein